LRSRWSSQETRAASIMVLSAEFSASE